MAISFVASSYTEENSNDTSFVLTKPTGVASGDLMLGFLSLNVAGSQVGVTPPSGWTLVRIVHQADDYPVQIAVMKRLAGGSEPASWTGSIASAKDVKLMSVSAYRGASETLIGEGGASTGSDASYSSATVNNTAGGAGWSVVAATYNSYTYGAWSVSTLTERLDDSHNNGSDYIVFVLADSNGSMTSGNKSYTINKPTSGMDSSASWHGILGEATGPVAKEAPATRALADANAYTAAGAPVGAAAGGEPGADASAHDAGAQLASSPTAGDSGADANAYDAATLLDSNPGAGEASADAVAHDATVSAVSSVSADASGAGALGEAYDATVSGSSSQSAPAVGAGASAEAFGPSALLDSAPAVEGAAGAAEAYDATVDTGESGDEVLEAFAPPVTAGGTAYDASAAMEAFPVAELAQASATAFRMDAPVYAFAELAQASAAAGGVTVGALDAQAFPETAFASSWALGPDTEKTALTRARADAVAYNATVQVIASSELVAPPERTFSIEVRQGRIYIGS